MTFFLHLMLKRTFFLNSSALCFVKTVMDRGITARCFASCSLDVAESNVREMLWTVIIMVK